MYVNTFLSGSIGNGILKTGPLTSSVLQYIDLIHTRNIILRQNSTNLNISQTDFFRKSMTYQKYNININIHILTGRDCVLLYPAQPNQPIVTTLLFLHSPLMSYRRGEQPRMSGLETTCRFTSLSYFHVQCTIQSVSNSILIFIRKRFIF